ncbi:MAG: pyridoxal-phosphate dependent enzyme [Pseudobdellovibrionaceae bacterium]
MIVEQMTDLIGNTPLLKLPVHVTGLRNIDLYVKLEMLNPFGSIKDRTAWGMIKDDLEMIKSKKMSIFENSSGNTAKSLQAIAGIHGIPFRQVSAFSKVEEQKHVMQIMGAEIEEIAGANDCFDPSDNNDPQYLIERTARARPGEVYFPSQFTNPKNPEYHRQTTGQEIVDDLGKVDFFFNGLGTTGSSLGITLRLREENPDLETVAVVPETNHFFPGVRSLSQMWESGIFKREQYKSFLSVTEQEAIDGMLELNRRCGVLCGVTAGASYMGALNYLRKIDGALNVRKTAVFIACDRMEWNISYLRERRPEIFAEPEKEHSLSCFTEESSVPTDTHDITPENFDDFIAADKKTVVVDIRTAQSFQLVCIPMSMNMPLDLFRKWIDGQNPFEERARVVLVCAVGEKSRYYAAYLRSIGCEAYSLKGGIMAWRDIQDGRCLAA